MVEVYNVAVFKNEVCPNGAIRLYWQGDIGFGQYDLIIKTNDDSDDDMENDEDYQLKIIGDSEYLDDNNKEFLKKLFKSLLDSIEVIG